MHIKIQQKVLDEVLTTVLKATSARSTLPILGYVLIRTEDAALSFSGTNLELGIIAHPLAEVIEPGSLALPAKLLHDYIHSLAPGEIEMRCSNEEEASVSVLITLGAKSRTNMKGMPATDFPTIPLPDALSPVITIEASLLKEAIGQVAFCSASDDARPVLTSIFCQVKEEMTLAAADAFRLGVRTSALPDVDRASGQVLIPARAMIELARILDKEGEVEMIMSPGRPHICFHTPNFTLVSKLIEGNFPPFKTMIPGTIPTLVYVNADELLAMCNSAMIFDAHTHILRMTIGALDAESGTNTLTLDTADEDTGSSTGAMQVRVEGPGDLVLSLNGKYLQEALAGIGHEEAVLGLLGPTKPCVLRPAKDETHQTYIIMPMNVTPKKK